MSFSTEERARIADAIGAAERGTAGEIVVIVEDTPERYPATAFAAAAVAAFTLPFVGVLLGWMPGALLPRWAGEGSVLPVIEGYGGVQALVFALTLALVWLARLDGRLTPGSVRRDRVHAAALTQFRARGFAATAGRTGVLLYIAMADHVAEIIADKGIYAKVGAEHWGETIAALVVELKAGRPADGIVAAIGLAGAVLAEHFPPSVRNLNELPDHLIEL